MYQMTIFDYVGNVPVPLPLGYLNDEDVRRYKGKLIPFRYLKQYINKKVLYETRHEDNIFYKVILIKAYYENCDKIYRQCREDPIGTCDRIGYSQDNRTQKEDSWVSENFFIGGRFSEHSIFLNQTFEIIGGK